MTRDFAIAILSQALFTEAVVMAPVLITGMVVGVLVGVLQAATQVNEPTLPFTVKIAAVGAVGGLLFQWQLDRLVSLFAFVVSQFGLAAGR